MKLNLNSNCISAYTLDSACSLHSDCTSAYCRWLLSPQTPITFHHQISTFKDFVTKAYRETHSYYILIILIMYSPWSAQSPLSWSPCPWRWWQWWPGTGFAHAREEQRGKPRTTERYTALWYKPSSQLSCLQCNGYGDNGHDENGYLWRIGEPCPGIVSLMMMIAMHRWERKQQSTRSQQRWVLLHGPSLIFFDFHSRANWSTMIRWVLASASPRSQPSSASPSSCSAKPGQSGQGQSTFILLLIMHLFVWHQFCRHSGKRMNQKLKFKCLVLVEKGFW